MRDEHGATVTWLPFDLHPEYPPEGIARADLRRRYGGRVDDHLRALFEQHGLAFAPSDRIPNSRAALRLTELARDHGLHDALHDRLMDAVWERGEDIGDHDVLRTHTDGAGLARDDVDRVLASDEYAERVAVSTAQASSLGINGIPAFLIDDRFLVLGAQPREVFERAFADSAA